VDKLIAGQRPTPWRPRAVMSERRRLLYISPVMPATGGNGLAMRAGAVLRALAERYRVSLLVMPLYVSPAAEVPAEIGERCEQIAVVAPALAGAEPPPPPAPRHPLLNWLRGAARSGPARAGPAERVPAPFREERFDVVHVFRLATLPFARPWLGARGRSPRRHLDLDDVEPITRRRLAVLFHQNGRDEPARREELEAARCEALQAGVLREFDRVYVCSEADRTALGRGGAEVCVLPNALPIPAPLPSRPTGGPFDFLFVGTLGYYPNEDAILHFCRESLPLIRRAARRAFRVTVVGTGATPAVRRLAALPEVRVIGAVPDVAPWYGAADAVVVPIRAGGGTRIKVLEAFGYRRPVVSTTVGIEGIEARADEHVLVGDTPAAFAERCLRLMSDPSLAERLTSNAFALFLRAYSTEAMARTVAALR
jgi:glycosyltransferase involved in cell wall biosynthesis